MIYSIQIKLGHNLFILFIFVYVRNYKLVLKE